jgi:alkanesulfonate monooxygenase SsuD/methylene tetrahydromethanopterin reductase-like flavin-dependent oxidoreductase (luciferase family)
MPKRLTVGGDFSDWNLSGLRDVVVRADAAGVEMIVLPDAIAPPDGGYSWPDALILIGWLAPLTKQVRLIGKVSSLGHQPYNLARRLASLDIISGGRAGWLVDDSQTAAAFAAFSGPQRLANVDLQKRQVEFESIVLGLWQSWDADALVHDKAGGQFFNPAAMHTLDHNGEYFSVKGPLNVMRSPAGAPALFHAGDLADSVTVESAGAALALLQEARS